MLMRNENSSFAKTPVVGIQRSRFDMNHEILTTANFGDLIIVDCQEVLPGDTFDVKTSKVVRLQTPLTPAMADMWLDFFHFFVPNRLVHTHWQNIMGENTDSAWIPQNTYSVPQIEPPSGGWHVGTIADYLGLPIGVDGFTVSAYPFRGYALICDEWFRSEAVQDPLNINKGDSDVTGTNGTNYITDTQLGGYPFVANKVFDYFTGALPSPQKGDPVTISVTSGGLLPVFAMGDDHAWSDLPKDSVTGLPYPIKFAPATSNNNTGDWKYAYLNAVPFQSSSQTDWETFTGARQMRFLETLPNNIYGLSPVNLYAGDTGTLSVATVNQLRTAFSIQKMLEKDARSGSRYIETIFAHFSVSNPDYRLQRPEYLGGSRIPIRMNQIVQTSETGSSPIGSTAGQSLTTDVHNDFVKSFTEHGYIFTLAVARYRHLYQNKIDRHWKRKERLDFFWPVFSNLGEQEIKNSEIFVTGISATDDGIFGYQERYAEYRYAQNAVTGEMRSAASNSLDSWHIGDDYSSTPSLSASWLQEDKTNVDRILAVTSSTSHQLLIDVYFDQKVTRAMPVNSIPGLIDHH